MHCLQDIGHCDQCSDYIFNLCSWTKITKNICALYVAIISYLQTWGTLRIHQAIWTPSHQSTQFTGLPKSALSLAEITMIGMSWERVTGRMHCQSLPPPKKTFRCAKVRKAYPKLFGWWRGYKMLQDDQWNIQMIWRIWDKMVLVCGCILRGVEIYPLGLPVGFSRKSSWFCVPKSCYLDAKYPDFPTSSCTKVQFCTTLVWTSCCSCTLAGYRGVELVEPKRWRLDTLERTKGLIECIPPGVRRTRYCE